MQVELKRRAVASVVGTMLFVLVLMMAMGAQLYLSGVQAQSSRVAQQGLNLAAARGAERVSFSSLAGGLSATSSGPTSSRFVTLVLRFGNGTAFDVQANTVVPSGSTVSLQPLASGGNCGSTSCIKRYNSIVSGASQGSVGVVTSLGNTFWYVPSQGAATGAQAQYYWTSSSQSTSSATFVPITGLSFSGSPGAHYQVTVQIGYYQSTASSPGISIGVSAPAGTTILGCGAINYPLEVQQCTTKLNTPIGVTIYPGNTLIAANYCANSNAPCAYVASILIAYGSTGGTFQLEYEDVSTTGTIVAPSVMGVLQS